MSRVLRLLAAVALLIPAAACGGADAKSSGEFATVEHKFGTTVIDDEPKRVLIAGLTEQDTVLQLGVKPIATTEWYGEQPDAVWPWSQKRLGASKPVVLTQADGPDFERIAELRPDLILAVNAGLDRATYAKLAKIAPTVAQPKGSPQYFSPWYEQVPLIAQALGKEQEGKDLVASVRERYAEIARQHPDWKGKTATFAQNAPYEGELLVYPDGLSTDYLTMLGFTMTPGLEKYADGPGSQAGISAERLDLIDADVMVFNTEEPGDIAKLRSMATFDQLDAVKKRRAIYTDATLAGAIYFDTPASLMYTADRLPRLLDRALAGRSPQVVGG